MHISRVLKFLRRPDHPAPRPPRCPSCLSERTAPMISASPEVYSFRCLNCQHEWAQLIRTPMPHWTDPLE
jgi:hypothetical protein